MGICMTSSDPERLERERLDADRRYNAALTELDRAVVAVSEAAAPPTRDDVVRVATALIVFLQQITAFVETKDRQIAADAARRVDVLAPAADSIRELRTQMTVMQRKLEALERVTGAHSNQPPATSNQQPAPTPQPPIPDVTYLAFEDEFRGSDATIEARLSEYVPLFEGADNVVDLGCGRGEFLAALAAAGVRGRGVDANDAMAAAARARGLDVATGDALAFLASLDDRSVGGLLAAQVVEHLEPDYLLRVIATAHRKLAPGAPIVLETINPACWLAFFSSYLRDLTHAKPIHPETLQYLLRAHGFERVSIRYAAPVPDAVRMKPVELPVDVLRGDDAAAHALADVAHTCNANAAILNNLLFSYFDYAAIGWNT
jgi:O-antigen chain-terminating methyltransferase